MANKNEQLEILRHSLAHILMQALARLYGAIPGVGPAIENGFYHDIDIPNSTKTGVSSPLESGQGCVFQLTPEDLPKIEKEMRKIIAENLPIEKKVMPIDEGIKFLNEKNYIYTAELAEDLKNGCRDAIDRVSEISFYQQGEFINMCKGPHLKSTGEINPDAFKLTRLAGAYWRGDEKNKMIQRVYGVAFNTKEELEKYLIMLEEAEKRDHRKLGKELDLFVFSDLVGKGLPLLTPKGSVIRQELERFIVDEETKRGYLRTYTPDMAKVELYKKSGHWEHYKDSMYPPMNVDGEEYVLRPMTCPHQFMIYTSRPRSYRDLPLRYAEIAHQYRKEQSGELTGLIRVMAFSLVDSHIICRPDQVEEEFEQVVDLIQYGMKTLGITDFWYRFSKWDPANKGKYIDDPASWDATQKAMKKILDKLKLKYVEADGEAAFYGPKLDVQLRNVNGKEDTAFTVQIDFALPERFEMIYTDKEGMEQRPMVIHRSSIGCIERTMAFLIEHYAGAFPLWLSPVQVKIISVREGHIEHCKNLANEFRAQNIRIELDANDETVGNKIRKARTEKIPYILVIGDKEISSDKLHINVRGQKEIIEMTKDEFFEKLKREIAERV
ncbi:MAG: threonine--tRNA ligase [bacterium]